MLVIGRHDWRRRTGRVVAPRAERYRGRRPRDHDRLACETLERRALLTVNVFDVNGTYTVDGNVGTLLGTLEVNTETGVVSGLELTRRGRISGTTISTRTYDTQSIRSQAASGSPLRYDLSATSATETVALRWNLPTGSLATFDGGSFTFTISNSNLGVFIPQGSGTLILVQPPNSAPTDITLAANTIAENSPIGTVIGTLATLDPDFGDSHTYSLVAGEGSTDNGSFQIVGNQLRAAATFDFEAKNSYSIRVRTTDAGGLSTEKQFSIFVLNVNEAPTDITLSANTIAENSPIGTVIGTLATVDPDFNDSHTYSLVAGDGSADNGSFQIVGNELRANASFDFETKNSYTIRVRTTDAGGLSTEKQFSIFVLGVNEAPTDITLSANTIAENSPVGTVIGTFATLDPDFGDSHTYALVAGAGSTDNGSFQVVGKQLRAAATFDLEAKNSYTIRVKTTDSDGLSIEKQFSIFVLDVNEAPTDITLSANTIAENSPIGTVIGTLATLDPDFGDSHTYTLVAGEGSADNASFQIVGNTLVSADVFDYESLFFAGRTRLQVRIRSTDQGGLSTEKAFSVQVLDVNEVPTAILLSSNTVPASHSAGFLVGALTTIDPDLNIRVIPLPVPAIFTYSFVAGPGDTHNSLFTVVRDGFRDVDELFLVAPLAAGDYTIRLRSTDPGGLFVEEQFIIVVENAAPTDIRVSNPTIPENSPVGTVVGQLTTVDANTIDAHTYTLVAGPGGTDNAWFQIVGNELRSRGVFDYETKNSYSVRIQATDSGGLSIAKPLKISVQDVNERPTVILLLPGTILENEPIGTLVGSFATLDPDFNDSHTYTLVAGDGSAGNGSFQIDGNRLLSNAVFDFETRSSYTIRVRTTDSGGLLHEQSFPIGILDVNESPADILLSDSTVPWDAPVGTPVGSFTAIDPDAGDWFVFSFTVGQGDAHNELFQIVGNELRTAADLRRPNRETLSIRVLVRDSEGLEFTKPFTIEVTGIPDVPGGIPAWFLPEFPDEALRNAAWERYEADNHIDRLEMISLIRTTTADDNLTGPELAGLQRIVSGRRSDEYEVVMPAHVRNLAGKVSGGFRPETTIGGAWSASAREVEDLVSKWFFGGKEPATPTVTVNRRYEYKEAMGSLFVDGPSIDDVIQGEANTCYFLATIGAAAEKYPGKIEELFIDNGDDTWTVRFYIWRKVDGATVRFEDYVTVDRRLPVDWRGTLVFASDGRRANDPTNELWVPLLEKAYAQWAETPDAVAPWPTPQKKPANAYSVIEFGLPDIAAAHILGTAPRTLMSQDGVFPLAIRSQVDAALAAGQMVMLGTVGQPDDNYLIRGHVYIVQFRSGSGEYQLIQPYDQPGKPRAVWVTGNAIERGNFATIVIADASRSLGDENRLVPQPGFGSSLGSIAITPGSSITPVARRPGIDLNGDGIADSLWRDETTGAVTGLIQDVLGNVILARSIGGDHDWRITAAGDFDGDGVTDLVWTQASTRLTMMETTRSRGPIRFTGAGVAEGTWSVIASGDYDGDGRSDLIWRNDSTGEHVLWLMNGHMATRQYRLGGDADWGVVAAAADFDANGDGTTDLVWRNASTGEHVVAFMQSGTAIHRQPVQPAIQPGGSLADWSIVASGDLNGNDRGDLLWRQATTGAMQVRPATGGPVLDWAALGLSFTDLNGDAQDDIAWWRSRRGIVVRRLTTPEAARGPVTVADRVGSTLAPPPWVEGRNS